uniref:Retrovirus-related Pol polyprotein from transposon TNT 1-94 n=1 Tax=Strongyloides papillosus TaxID=174720 RepID=A0A0N5BQ77_STREA
MGPEDSKKDIELKLAQAFKIVKGLPFVKLSGPTNFRQWLNDMKTLCLTIGVDFDDMKKLSSQNKDVILRLLNLYIDSELRNDLLDFTCPIELLEEVRTKYLSTSLISRMKLQKSLYHLSMGSEETIMDLISRLNTICRSLKGINVNISEEDKIIILLAALPDRYESFISSLNVKDTYNNIVQRLKAINELPCNKDKLDTNSQTAFYLNQRNNSITCLNCGGKGHVIKQCPSPKIKSYNHKFTHEALLTWPSSNLQSNDSDIEWALSAKGVNYTDKNYIDTTWFLDSGATVHLCRNSKLLVNLVKIDPVSIMVANGQFIHCNWSGQLILSDFIIENVYYNPDLAANLVSLVKLKEIATMFIEDGNICFRRNNSIIKTIQLNKNIVVVNNDIQNKVYSAYKVTPELWHERLLHISNEELNHHIGHRMSNKCVSCSLAKISCSPHPTNDSSVSRPLELVYFDLAGKITPKGLHGEEYYCIALDQYSKATQIIPLKSKSDTLQAIRQIISLWESLVGKPVERVRTDHGKEFENKETLEYFSKKDIIKEWSCVGTPQQISVERYNRYVKENVATIIINRRLPKNTWSLICTSVPYVKNRIRSSATKIEPMKLLGLKFSIEMLRCIGSMVVYKKDEHIKMDMKGNIGVFLAYGPKNSYKIMDIATHNIKITSNVKFYEEYDYVDAKAFYKRLILHETKIPQHITSINELDIYTPTVPVAADTRKCDKVNVDATINHTDKETILDTKDMKTTFDNTTEIDVLNLSNRLEDISISENKTDYIRNPRNVVGSPITKRTRSGDSAFFTISPSGYLEASQSPEWIDSMKKELESLIKNDTWAYVKKSEIDKERIITCKWVYTVKNDGRLKSRLTARGFQQSTQSETYSPTVHPSVLKSIISIGVQIDMKIHTMDCTNAFLQGEFEEDETVYMSLPKGIELINSPPKDNVVCKLLKPIYGLRQSSRCWYRTLVDFLTTNANFNVSDFDSCVLFTHNPTLIIIILYVDDIMILSQNIVLIDKIKQRITSRFEAKDYGQIMNTEYIGLEFKVQYDEIFVSQEIRIRKLIDEYSCLNIVPKKNINVPKGEVLESDILDEKQHSNFRKIVGKLSYISNLSRPDITYSVNYLQRVLEKPRKCHLSLAINIISYLMKFPNLPLHFKKSTRPPLEVYSDASYASSKDSHSTTGILIMVYGAPVYWATKKQSTISLSSSEAEIKAAVEAVKQMIWIKKIFSQIFNKTSFQPILYIDNIPSINIMKNNEITNARMRHTNINLTFLKEVKNSFKYINTNDQLADALTKSVSTQKLLKLFGYEVFKDAEGEVS